MSGLTPIVGGGGTFSVGMPADSLDAEAHRRVRWGAVALTLSFVAALLHAAPAKAAICGKNGQIFVRSKSARKNTLGTRNEIKYRVRDLDRDCEQPRTLSTAHISKSFSEGRSSGSWVEIGWQEAYRGGVTHWIFVEKGRNHEVLHLDSFAPIGLEPGTFDRWIIRGRHVHMSGQLRTQWSLRVNTLNGGGTTTYKIYTTNWLRGVALGEAERFGRGTGMADVQKNLKFLHRGLDAWKPWPGVNCVWDDDPKWEWKIVNDTRYKVVKDGQLC